MRRMQRTHWWGVAAPTSIVRAALVSAAAACLFVGCSLMPQNSGDLRIDEVQRALLPMARVALDTGQLETAKRLYQRLLEVDPESFDARMGLGNVAFKDRRSTDAARWYLAALTSASTASERYDALLWHGRSALDDGQLQEARRSFQALVEERERAPATNVAWALNGIGLTLLLDGDILGAINAMEQAVQQAGDEKMFADNLERALNMLADLRAGEGDDSVATLSPTPSEIVPETPQALAQPSVAATEPPTVTEPPAADLTEPTLPTETETVEPDAQVVAAQEASEDVAEPAEVRDEEITEPAAVADQSVLQPPPTVQDPSSETAATAQQGDETATTVDQVSIADALEPSEPPTALPSTSTPPPPAPPPPTEAGYVLQSGDGSLVQMGAFAVRSSAEAFAKGVGEATDAPIEVVESNGFYRVLIGPLASEAALDAVERDLARQGYYITRDSTPSVAKDRFVMPQSGFVLVEDDQRFLQLGAFEARGSADNLADKLAEVTGDAVAVAESRRNGVPIYRVRIGPFASDDELAEMVATLTSVGYEID